MLIIFEGIKLSLQIIVIFLVLGFFILFFLDSAKAMKNDILKMDLSLSTIEINIFSYSYSYIFTIIFGAILYKIFLLFI
ncbi:hypothetical protein ACN09X_04680 [Aliarcobacter butzleri]|uniref:hypothetical protein n=1 Tax=Arcobacteraceae TaxID=2808963 RepID=UPI0021BA6138|nr:hypothetical protein [Arcobacter lacus]MCT7910734.1 hypothetical protein [Arcobacter lacus]